MPGLSRELSKTENNSLESPLLRLANRRKTEHDSRDFPENASPKIQELTNGEISLRTEKNA
jgi:hypothetical protein